MRRIDSPTAMKGRVALDDKISIFVVPPGLSETVQVSKQRYVGGRERAGRMEILNRQNQWLVRNLRKLPIFLPELREERASQPDGNRMLQILRGLLERLNVGDCFVGLDGAVSLRIRGHSLNGRG